MIRLSIILGLALSGEPSEPVTDPAAFPVPAEKGMHLDAKATQFRVPFGFARVERFYRDQFGGRKDIAFAKAEEAGQPTLTIRSLAKTDRWTKAMVRTDGATCTITVTRVVVMDAHQVDGELPPVQFVISRSTHVKEQLDSIEHVEH
jgi:hypothetical protein